MLYLRTLVRPSRRCRRSREDDGPDADVERHELSVAAEAPERLEHGGVRGGRPPREHVLGQPLTGERRRLHRLRLRPGRALAGHGAGRDRAALRSGTAASPWCARRATRSLLARLRDGVDAAPVVRHRHQRRRRRQNRDPRCRDGRSGNATAACPWRRRARAGCWRTGCRRDGRRRRSRRPPTGRHEDDAARASTAMPAQLLAPPLLSRAPAGHVGAGLTGSGDGPEVQRVAPVRTRSPGCRRETRAGLLDASADDQQIAVDHARRGEPHRLQLRRPPEAFVQIDPAGAAERLDRRAGFGIEGVEVVVHGREDARRLSVGPIRHAAVRAAAGQPRIERPADRAGGGIERDGLVQRRRGVERAADDDRVRLQAAFLARVIGPRDAKALHVVASDPRQRRVADRRRAAAIGRPVLSGRHGLAATRRSIDATSATRDTASSAIRVRTGIRW